MLGDRQRQRRVLLDEKDGELLLAVEALDDGEDLLKALDKNKVAKKDQEELIGLLAPMKKDIVGQ